MIKLINSYINLHHKIFNKIDKTEIIKAFKLLDDYYLKENFIFTCGNGGSAYAASHAITDWNKMANIIKKKKFKSISLCDNVGILTAYANDISYDKIFSGQLESLMTKNDLLLSISGSGNSKNVINAINYANSIGAKSLSLVGYDGGLVKKISTNCIHVPIDDMQICEDLHLSLIHLYMKKLIK